MMEKKELGKRNLGLEWLRICSMFMIILLHSIDHSGLYETLEEGTLLYAYEQFIYALVQVGVNCFVLISGYFLVQSQFKLRKLILLWIEVVFYAVTIKFIMRLVEKFFFGCIFDFMFCAYFDSPLLVHYNLLWYVSYISVLQYCN